MSGPLRNERGAVLLLVLLVVALLAGILTDWASSTLVDLRLAETFRDSNRAYYLARGGVEAGRMLIADDRNNYDGAGELWAQGVPSYPVADDAAVTITIEDQDGRLDLNKLVDATGYNPDTVYYPRLVRLLRRLDIPDPEGLKDALIDWLDKGENSMPGGAESAYYRTLSPPYAAKNGLLDTLDELRLVRGFTPEVVAKLAPLVTALPANSGRQLNVNSAPAEVLAVWKDDAAMEQIAEQLVKGRESGPYQNNDAVKQLLGDSLYGVINAGDGIGVKSDYYRIVARGEVGDGRRSVEALLKKPGSTILYQRVY